MDFNQSSSGSSFGRGGFRGRGSSRGRGFFARGGFTTSQNDHMSLNGEQGTSALFSNSRGRGAGFKRPSRPGSGSFRGAIKSQNRSKVFNSSPSTQIQQSEEEDIQSQDVEDSSLVVTTQDRAARFTASPSENRYLELKALRSSLRDKYISQGLMPDPTKKYTLGSAPPLTPLCMDMCPEFERHEREYQKGLDKFERLDDAGSRVDHQKAVKRYRRSAAGDEPPLPSDVRPPAVLEKTLSYLLNSILTPNGLSTSHSFIRDRFRAIRNDLTLQNYRGPEAIILHEKIARFHILSSHALMGNEGLFMQQEHEQMRKTLQSLMEFYAEARESLSKNDEKWSQALKNEAEFQAYYILTHPWTNDTVTRAEIDFPEHVFDHPLVQRALLARQLMTRLNETTIRDRPRVDGSLNDFTRLFRVLKDPNTPFLFACCTEMEFIDIRRGALKAMNSAFLVIPEDLSTYVPVSYLVDALAFDDEEEAISHLVYYEVGVEVVDEDGMDGGTAYALLGKQKVWKNGKSTVVKTHLVENQRVSLPPKKAMFVEEKRTDFSDVDIILGRDLTGQSRSISSSAMPQKPAFATNLRKSTLISEGSERKLRESKPTELTTAKTPAFSFLSAGGGNTLQNGAMNGAPAPMRFNTPVQPQSAPIPAFGTDSVSPFQLGISTPLNAPMFSQNIPASLPTSISPFKTPEQQTASTKRTHNFEAPASDDVVRRDSTKKQKRKTIDSSPASTPQAGSSFNFPTSTPSTSTPPAINFSHVRNMSQPKPITSQKPTLLWQQYEKVKEDVVYSLLNPIIQETANDILALVKEESFLAKGLKSARGLDVVSSILDDLFVEEITNVTKETFSTMQEISVFRDVVQAVAEEVIDEYLPEGLCRVVSEVLREEYMSFQQQRFVFDRWTYVVQRNNFRRQRKGQIVERWKVQLGRSVLSPLGVIVPAKASLSFSGIKKRDSFSEKAVVLAKQAQAEKKSWLEPLSLLDIFQAAFSEPPYDPYGHEDANPTLHSIPSYIKIVLYASSSSENGSSLPDFANTWVASQFRVENSGIIAGKEDILETLFRDVVKFKVTSSSATASRVSNSIPVLIQRVVDPSRLSQGSQLSNQESDVSGINAAIFQVTPHLLSRSSSTKWKAEAERFQMFIMSLPSASKIPVLVIYHEPKDVKITPTQISEILQTETYSDSNGQLSHIHFCAIPLDAERFDANEAKKALTTDVSVLVQQAWRPPVLSNAMEDLFPAHMCRYMDFLVDKIVSTLPGSSLLHKKSHVLASACISNMMSVFVSSISGVLLDKHRLQVAFPPVEFSADGNGIKGFPPMDWNSLQKQRHILQVAESFSLPDMSAMNIQEDSIEANYLDYVKGLKRSSILSEEEAGRLYSVTRDLIPNLVSNHDKKSLGKWWKSLVHILLSACMLSLSQKTPYFLLEATGRMVSSFISTTRSLLHEWMMSDDVRELSKLKMAEIYVREEGQLHRHLPRHDGTEAVQQKRRRDFDPLDRQNKFVKTEEPSATKVNASSIVVVQTPMSKLEALISSSKKLVQQSQELLDLAKSTSHS